MDSALTPSPSAAGTSGPDPSSGAAPTASVSALTRYFLRLGTLGFGGPIALTAAMRRDLVDERGWVTVEEYKEGLALAQLAPGPLAAQLAIYLGWSRGGVLGATLAGLAFVGPSFLMVMVLSVFYLRFGELAWMQGAFYGIGAAVIAIIARGAGKLLGSSIGRDLLLWAVVLVNAVVVAWAEAEILWVLALSGLVVVVWRRLRERAAARNVTVASVVPLWLITGIHGPASSETLAQILGFFAKAAVVVFGSGLAVVPFLHGGVVGGYGWLTERQFLDAVAVSMITPGPVVITVAFIGYLVAGPVGGTLAAIGMFLPTYLAVVLAAPFFHRVTANRHLKAAVDGVTAAATGAIAGAVVVLGRRAIIDAATVGIALVTLLVLLRLRRVPEPIVIVAAGVVGVVLTQVR
jgi:chromate transporter